MKGLLYIKGCKYCLINFDYDNDSKEIKIINYEVNLLKNLLSKLGINSYERFYCNCPTNFYLYKELSKLYKLTHIKDINPTDFNDLILRFNDLYIAKKLIATSKNYQVLLDKVLDDFNNIEEKQDSVELFAFLALIRTHNINTTVPTPTVIHRNLHHR